MYKYEEIKVPMVKCCACGKLFDTKDKLEAHIKKEHKDVKYADDYIDKYVKIYLPTGKPEGYGIVKDVRPNGDIMVQTFETYVIKQRQFMIMNSIGTIISTLAIPDAESDKRIEVISKDEFVALLEENLLTTIKEYINSTSFQEIFNDPFGE